MKVYVANLTYETNEQTLAAFLEGCGEIRETKIIYDRATGQSRGFGFVTFATQEAADSAIKMSEQRLDGRPLIIKQAEERRQN